MADDYSAPSHEADAQPGAPQGQAEPLSGTQAAPEGAQAFAGDPAAGPAVGPGQVPPGPIFQGAGYVMDPVTGQLYYKVPVQPEPGVMPQGPVPPGMAYAGTVPPGAVPPGGARQEVPPPPGPDYAEVMKSVEQFAEGDATVADVVKTLYTNTAQDDQFWKGALVGAAAAVLLTSGPVKETMGKTFGSLFGKSGDAGNAAAGAPTPDDKKE